MTAQEALAKAVNLGLITAEQVKAMITKYREDELIDALEKLVSDQMSPGQQCIGDHCSI